MRSLADTVMAACSQPTKTLDGVTPDGQRRLATTLKTKLRASRRYFIDEDVTRATTKLGVMHPDILMSMLRRARAPFATCWVEWPCQPQIEEAGNVYVEGAPERVGAFVERLDEHKPIFRLTIVTKNSQKLIVVAPLCVDYNLDEPVLAIDSASAVDAEVAAMSALPIPYIRASLVGSAFTQLPGMDAEEAEFRRACCDKLVAHATYRVEDNFRRMLRDLVPPRRIAPDTLKAVMQSAVVEHSGLWRFVVSLFALINSRDYVASENVVREKNGSRLVAGKLVPYLDHHLVSLKLPRAIVEPSLLRSFAEAIPRRLHDVSGHWKHSRKKFPARPGCEHVFVADTATRELCMLCGHKRWWVNDFQRGDAQIGIIIKDRLVERR